MAGLAGEGSLTQVYRARPAGTGAEHPAAYAVKLLRPFWQQDRQAVAVMRREVRVGRAVSHPHLIPILAAGVRQPPYFLVMPWLAGRTLAAAYDVDRLLRRVELLSASMSEALDSVALHEELFLARPSIRPVQSGEAWVSSSFSRSRFHPLLLVNRPHPGVDISAAAGTPILATGKGRVVFAGTRSGYGKTVEIDHGHGYRTLYAHAGALSVKKGQRVERGDVLGEVGKSGLATAPHLHYEVIVNDRQVNPDEYMVDDRVH